MISMTYEGVLKSVLIVKEQLLPEYERSLKAIDDVLAGLQAKGKPMRARDVPKLAGFNPWRYHSELAHEIERATELLKKTGAGQALPTGETLYGISKRFSKLPEEMRRLMNKLDVQVEDFLYHTLERRYKEALDDSDLETAKFFKGLMKELVEAGYQPTLTGIYEIRGQRFPET